MLTHSAGIIGLGWRGGGHFEEISLSTDPVIKLQRERREGGWPDRANCPWEGGCVRVLELCLKEECKHVAVNALVKAVLTYKRFLFTLWDISAALWCHSPTSTTVHPTFSLCLHSNNVIRPMGVRPDGTLAPLEETLCDPPEENPDSDSD